MYRRKSVGPRIYPWETSALTGYSREDFPSRTTWSCFLVRQEEIRPNIWSKIPKDLNFWRRPATTLLKALDISRATAQAAPALLKTLAIPSDTITVRRSVVDQEVLKPYWKSEKSCISLRNQQSYYL